MVMIDHEGANHRPLNSAIRQLVYDENGQNIRTVMVGGEIVVCWLLSMSAVRHLACGPVQE